MADASPCEALSLPGPIWTREGAPSRADRIVISRQERARGRIADILRDALGSRRADNRGADAGGAERESERGRDRVVGIAAEKIVVESLQPIPIWLRVPIGGRLAAAAPCGVGNRTLDDHTHRALASFGYHAVDCFLVRDAQRDLQGVEDAHLDGVERGVGVAAVSDVAGLAGVARAGE